ncbi:MAG: branched-chain amino acid ABC transporter permease [Lachnospiraceae bacterium]
MKKKTKVLGIAIVLVIAIVFPLLNPQKYYIHMVSLSLIWVIMTQGLNVIQGLTGYVSITQASFYGIGAYTSALLSIHLGWSFWITLPLSVLFSAITGILIGYPSLKTKGHYFSIITIAFCFILYSLMGTFKFTGGTSGLPNIKSPTLFGVDFSNTYNYYYLILVFVILTVFIVYRIKYSRYGRALITIRENEDLAQAIGVSLANYKLLAFLISAVFGGLAGVLYAHYNNFINPVPFSTEYSMNGILAIIMGGSGTIVGPIIGSFMLVFLPEYLRMAESFRLIIYSLLLIVITIFMPKGITHAVKVLFQSMKGFLSRPQNNK